MDKGIFSGIGLAISTVVFYIFCLNHVAPQEIGIAYNSLSGEVYVQNHPGWYVTNPFVEVASVETRPFQVCLNAGARILNCKLIRFNPEGASDFVKLQGFHYWNTSVNQCGNPGCSTTEFGRIMLGYAYSEKSYPFLEIIEEIKPDK